MGMRQHCMLKSCSCSSKPDFCEMSAAQKKSQEEIIAQFNRLRQEQRNLAAKLSELQMDLNEHKLVIETLNDVDPDRKCFRMIGGVLVERTVKEVTPALSNNRDKMTKLIETLETQLTEKGQEINGYIEKHNIQIRGQPGAPSAGKDKEEEESKSSGVLVASKSYPLSALT